MKERCHCVAEVRDLDKLKSKLEINMIMKKRMLDTCQYIEYGL